MSGFFFRGVRQSPNGDMVPDLPMSQSAYGRIRDRWSAVQFIDERGEPIEGERKESLLHEIAIDDALWQFWLSQDLKEDDGELAWLRMTTREKEQITIQAVRDGKWWKQWAEDNLGYREWPWQKRLAFERTAVRESMNAESTTPTTPEMDSIRQELVRKMAEWIGTFDKQNPSISPYDVPSSYIGLSFETI